MLFEKFKKLTEALNKKELNHFISFNDQFRKELSLMRIPKDSLYETKQLEHFFQFIASEKELKKRVYYFNAFKNILYKCGLKHDFLPINLNNDDYLTILLSSYPQLLLKKEVIRRIFDHSNYSQIINFKSQDLEILSLSMYSILKHRLNIYNDIFEKKDENTLIEFYKKHDINWLDFVKNIKFYPQQINDIKSCFEDFCQKRNTIINLNISHVQVFSHRNVEYLLEYRKYYKFLNENTLDFDKKIFYNYLKNNDSDKKIEKFMISISNFLCIIEFLKNNTQDLFESHLVKNFSFEKSVKNQFEYFKINYELSENKDKIKKYFLEHDFFINEQTYEFNEDFNQFFKSANKKANKL